MMKQRCLIVRSSVDFSFGRYAHITGSIAHLDETKETGFKYDCHGDDYEIGRISFTSQMSESSSKAYGMELFYESGHRLTLYEAQTAAKALAPFERKLTKLNETDGYVATLGQWINRVAKVTGCEKVCIQRDAEFQRRTGHCWQTVSLGDAVSIINSIEAELVAQCNPQAKLAEAA